MSKALPSEWASVRIRDLAKIVYGKALQAGSRVESGNAIVYGSSGIVGRHNNSLHEGPSIVIGRKGNVGAVYYVNHPFWCIDTAFYLDDINTMVDLEFLAHALQVADLAQYIKSVAVPGISRDDIENTVIPLPPLPEQRRIAAILREADEIRKLRKQANEKAQGIVQALFYDFFGRKKQDLIKISKLGAVQYGLTVNSQRSTMKIQAPYLRVANVHRDKLNLSEISAIGVKENELEKYLLQRGDILVVEGHADPSQIGRSAVWQNEIQNCLHQNHLLRIRPNLDLVSPYYLTCFLNSATGIAYMQKHAKTSSGLNTINSQVLADMPVMYAPISQQKNFERCYLENRNLLVSSERSLSRFDALYQSLLSQAFTGKLTATWRESHAIELAHAAQERDLLLGNLRHKPIVHEIESAFIPPLEVLITDERSTLLETLSPLQNALYTIMQKRKDTYFAATKLHSDMQTCIDEYNQYHVEQDTEQLYQDFVGLNCSLDTLRRELHALATMGLVRETALPVEDEDAPDTMRYVTVYRFLQVGDDCQQEDLTIINPETAREVLV